MTTEFELPRFDTLESGPTRSPAFTQRIGPEVTGLKTSIYIHTEFGIVNGSFQVIAIRCSGHGKDGSTLDRILTAVGESITDIIRDHVLSGPHAVRR